MNDTLLNEIKKLISESIAYQNQNNKQMYKIQIQYIRKYIEQLNNNIQEEYKNNFNIMKKLNYISVKELKKYTNKYYKELMAPIKNIEYCPKKAPTLKEYQWKVGLYKKNILLEFFDPNRKPKRIMLEQKAEEEYKKDFEKYQENEKRTKKEYYIECLKNQIDNLNKNKEILKKHKKYINCNKKEVLDVMGKFIKTYNALIKEKTIISQIDYDSNYKACYLEVEFFPPHILNKIKKYSYKADVNKLEETFYNVAELNKEYEALILQLSLKRIFDTAIVFQDVVEQIIFNGYVYNINPLNGKNEKIYLINIKCQNNDIVELNLNNINYKLCLDKLNSKYSANMYETLPIKPLKFDFNKLDADSIQTELDGFAFENLSKELLMANGYEEVIVTKSSGDYGADVIAIKDEIKYAIQCKKSASKIGVAAVQEVIASKSIYKCHVAVVFTNNYFTSQAQKLAEQNKVLLWDKNKLEQMITNLDKMKD